MKRNVFGIGIGEAAKYLRKLILLQVHIGARSSRVQEPRLGCCPDVTAVQLFMQAPDTVEQRLVRMGGNLGHLT